MSVLFVCTGNTCRSPMAQAIYEHLTGKEAKSGGLGVSSPQPVSEQAIAALHIFPVRLPHRMWRKLIRFLL